MMLRLAWQPRRTMTLRFLALAIAVGLAVAPAASAAGALCGPGPAEDCCCCPQASAGPTCAMGCSEDSAATLLPALPSPLSRQHVQTPAACFDALPGAAAPLLHEAGGRFSAACAGLHAPPEALYLLYRNLRL